MVHSHSIRGFTSRVSHYNYYMCMCVYVCIYIYIYIYAFTYIYIYICIYIYIYIYIYTYIYFDSFANSPKHPFAAPPFWLPVTRKNIYIYIYIHIYIYIYVYSIMYLSLSLSLYIYIYICGRSRGGCDQGVFLDASLEEHRLLAGWLAAAELYR